MDPSKNAANGFLTGMQVSGQLVDAQANRDRQGVLNQRADEKYERDMQRQEVLDDRADEIYTDTKARSKVVNAQNDQNYARGVLDHQDAKARNKKLDARGDQLHARGTAEYNDSVKRREVMRDREDEQYQEGKVRQKVADAMDMFRFQVEIEDLPIARQIRQAELKGLMSSNEASELRNKVAKQAATAQEAMAVASMATSLNEQGDYEGALQYYEELGNYGFDVKQMDSVGAQRAMDTTQKLLTGEMNLKDPEAVWLAEQVLGPAFAQSGRDGQTLKIAGLTQIPGTDRVAVRMERRQGGDAATATLRGTTDPKDVVREISMDELMGATSNWIDTASQIDNARRMELGVKTNAIIANLNVKMGNSPISSSAKQKADRSEKSKPSETDARQTQNKEDFLKSYESNEGLHAIGTLLMQREPYNMRTSAATIAAIDEYSIKHDVAPQEAVALYFNEKDKATLYAQQFGEMTDMGLSEKDAKTIMKRVIQSQSDPRREPLNFESLAKEKLDQYERKKERAEASRGGVLPAAKQSSSALPWVLGN